VRQALGDGLCREIGKNLQQRHSHLGTNDRGGLEETLLHRREVVNARRQHALNSVREPEGSWEGTLLPHSPGEFFQKERIACRSGDNGLQQRLWKRRALQDRLHHGPTVLR
jgi:hypothetical protein